MTEPKNQLQIRTDRQTGRVRTGAPSPEDHTVRAEGAVPRLPRIRLMYFTDAHEELRLHIRRFLEKEVRPHLAEWEETLFPDSIMKRFGEMGLLGLRYDPEYGGQGGDYFSAIVLSEEMARAGCGGLGMAVAVQTEMATPPLNKFGTPEQKRKWLAPAISGDAIAAIAMTEPDAGSDLANIQTIARKDGNEWVINGRKIFITNGARASWTLLVTKGDRERGHKGYNLILVEKTSPGFSVTRTLEKLGMHSSDTAELLFEDCRVPLDNLIGEEGEGFKQLMWELQGERLIAACGAVAGAQKTFEYAMDYAKERRAFGQPTAEHQVIKHKLVDMATDVNMIRAFVHETGKPRDQGAHP